MNYSILAELARALTREDFVARLPDPVLIVMSELEVEEASGDDDTQVGEQIAGVPKGLRTSVPNKFEALAVRKKRHSEDKGHITVGRERTCDIVVRTPGISKHHAHFIPGETLQLVDLNSQNGTWVDGARIAPDRPVEIKPGTLVTFGDLVTQLVSPLELYRLLKSARS